jgi:endonuclease I
MRKILILLFVIFLNACIINNVDLNDYINEVVIEYQEGDSQFQVTQNITLVSQVSNEEIAVEWSSSKADIISISGKVTRPDQDTAVELTVTLTYLQESLSKNINLIVLKKEVGYFEITINIDGVNENRIYYEPVKLDDILKPEKEGYIFKDWTDTDGNILSLETIIDKDVTIIAIFEEVTDNSFFITIIIEGQIEKKYFDGPIFLSDISIPEKEGYEFSYWTDSLGNILDSDYIINQDISITPIFRLLEYNGYYSTLMGVSNENLYSILMELIQDYTYTSYGYARDILQESDEDPERPENVILVYSRESVRSQWDSGRTWNREHVWPQSKLPNEDSKDDVHNLRPCDPSVNSSRGNSKFSYSDGSSEYGYHNTGGWYPGDEDRGDIARIVMYMSIMWEINIDSVGNIQLFLQWHEEDPVDDFESNRNNVIFQYTNNRNPFIDHPELAYRIFGEPSDNIHLIKILESTNNLLTLNKVMLLERKIIID